MTATTRDAGSSWYNPAGLGANRRNRLDLSTSAFILRRRKIEDGLITRLPGGVDIQSELSETELTIAAPALSYLREIMPGLTVGLGFFVSEQLGIKLRSETEEQVIAGTVTDQVGVDIEIERYHIGPSIGYEITPSFRIGMSIFGVYERQTFDVFFGLDVQFPNIGIQSSASVLATGDSTRLALETILGAQWQPTPKLHIGLSLRSPLLLLKEYYQGDSLTLTGTIAPEDDPSLNFESIATRDSASPGLISPTIVTLGVAYELPRGWVSIEGDFNHPIENEEAEVDIDWAYNFRAGFRLPLNTQWTVGLGAYTNLSSAPPAQESFSSHIDYVGTSGGVTYASPVKLANTEEASDLVFATTLALNYAIGFGEFTQLISDFRFEQEEDPSVPENVDVLFHEFSVMIGSGLRF